jgi:hypothetical protein
MRIQADGIFGKDRMIANIASDDVLILPHHANPAGLNFRERHESLSSFPAHSSLSLAAATNSMHSAIFPSASSALPTNLKTDGDRLAREMRVPRVVG